MRVYENDEEEAASIIAWTERRLEMCVSSSTVRAYIKLFKQMWKESFGSLDSVPQEFKDKVEKLHNELKVKERIMR